MIVETSAPSNIALIKYMGKQEGQQNVPTNSSLSWTLDEMRTFVRITLQESFNEDRWQLLPIEGVDHVQLSEASIRRFLNHFAGIKKQWGIEKCFLVESANNFPSDCGLASSASSFAALTKGAVEMFQQIHPRAEIGLGETAELSRQGSGSSCRSFFGPWAVWHKAGVRPMEFPMSQLLHQVVVVNDQKKSVSSSEAHRRVISSYLFKGRIERAERRLAEAIHALQTQDWKALFETTWSEFWDMHSLFETSNPPFGYLQSTSLQVLETTKKTWEKSGDGPVVTMDAGANVHLLWRSTQADQAIRLSENFAQQFRILSCKSIRDEMGQRTS